MFIYCLKNIILYLNILSSNLKKEIHKFCFLSKYRLKICFLKIFQVFFSLLLFFWKKVKKNIYNNHLIVNKFKIH
jgi:hypothetical protein